MLKFETFSPKQREVLTWWFGKKYRCKSAIICDGSVRSGKTVSMGVSFVLWAMSSFDRTDFAICGKTITSVKRNLADGLAEFYSKSGFAVKAQASKNYFTVSHRGRENRFYLFGGKDEGSAALIQGMTLGGVLLDEVALMPRSFVEQAIARCSLESSKLWFNCNPDSPSHWFYTEWIQKAEEKNALYFHFTMDDNPSLSKEVRERYERLYSGTFYQRFVLGKWVAVSGCVYPMFDRAVHVVSEPPECRRFAVSCDYGTVNPSSFGLWGESGGVWYRLSEYYYSSKREGAMRTDEEHYEALERLCGDRKIETVICDPSAASFLECIRRHGKYSVTPADNDVLSGIRRVGDALRSRKILISAECRDCIREFALYRWDEKGGRDSVVKENDHAMDDLRYFVAKYLGGSGEGDWFFASVER